MNVTFYEEGHKYLADNGEQYTSATTLLGKYKEPFDAGYWSTYKAIEQLVCATYSDDYWNKWKANIGFKEVTRRYIDILSESQIDLIPQFKKEILEKWEYEKNIACFNGTNFHKAKEDGWLNEPKHYEGVIKRGWHSTGTQFVGGNNISPEKLPDGVYSELVLWNHYYKIAGQADIVYIETIDGVRYIDIDDYKTNKKIDKTSYLNPRTRQYKMMQRPLSNIMDCNGSHYELQISLYAWLLSQFGFKPRHLNFQHWNNVGTKENPKYDFAQDYVLAYREKEIVKVLEHFKNNN